MDKHSILVSIENARKSHLLWLKRIKHLVEDIPVDDGLIALDPTKSGFGRWLYEDVTKCRKSLFFSESLDAIEKEHLRLHEVYFNIYGIYFVQAKRTILASLFLGKRKDLEPEQEVEVIKYYNKLIDISVQLMWQLNNFERKIRITSDSVIEKCLFDREDTETT